MKQPRPCWLHGSHESSTCKRCMESPLLLWLHESNGRRLHQIIHKVLFMLRLHLKVAVAFYGRPIRVLNFFHMEPPGPCWVHRSYESSMCKRCMEPLLLWWLLESSGQRPKRNICKMCSMLKLHPKVARCIWWSTHRVWNFFNMEPPRPCWLWGRYESFMCKNVWSHCCFVGAMNRTGKGFTETFAKCVPC